MKPYLKNNLTHLKPAMSIDPQAKADKLGSLHLKTIRLKSHDIVVQVMGPRPAIPALGHLKLSKINHRLQTTGIECAPN